ncbi:ParA family protein [Moraxella sp. ZJ142]|uniref:ParA family protein n=1 Tax=Moraxella marmotae TaxID=3344520 RepID=UPI0035D4A47D
MSKKQTRIIALTNHKGGCGKTTTVVHLAAELAHLGLSVLVVDLDPQANSSDHIGKQHSSLNPLSVRDLLLKETDNIMEVIQFETRFDGVALLPSSLSLTVDGEKIKDRFQARPFEALKKVLAPAVGVFDVILIDTPPHLGILTANALGCATDYIIPVFSGSQYGLSGTTTLQQYIGEIREVNPELNMLGVLLLHHDSRTNVCRTMKEVVQETFEKIIPIDIPTSTKMEQTTAMQTSIRKLDPTSKVARAFRKLGLWVAAEIGFAVTKDAETDADDTDEDAGGE